MLWRPKTTRDRADVLFSIWIRERDNWHCRYRILCSGNEDFRENKGGLHNSHCFSRGMRTVRFDKDNCDSGCYKCHDYFEKRKKELEAWKKSQLGDERFRQLRLRAFLSNRGQKPDKKMELLWVKTFIKNNPIII